MKLLGEELAKDGCETQQMFDAGIVSRVGQQLTSPSMSLRKVAAGMLSNLVGGNLTQLQMVLEANLMPTVIDFAIKENYFVRRECIFALYNAINVASLAQTLTLIKLGVTVPLCLFLGTNDLQGLDAALYALETLLSKAECMRTRVPHTSI